ncbi:MAG TPA: hypothetical protein VFC05_08400 [Nitrososphaeraceae archaeon]|jgi:hypothetical protein|nr:hypothetical protein [Nitrososphaeraceae archaeon]
MKQYIKFSKFKIIVTGILALVSLILLARLLNYENALGFSLLIIGGIVTIGYTYLKYNYYRKMNKLDKKVLESLK